jgi:hypothetical protein
MNGMMPSDSECTSDLIHEIKERLFSITRGDFSEPVYLSNVSILDHRQSGTGETVYLKVNSIFCDDEGVLCGDLVSENGNYSSNILFGQSIEEIPSEELENILDHLNDENWSVILNDAGPKKNSFLKVLKRVPLAARGA